MFWIADADFVRRVNLHWTRRAKPLTAGVAGDEEVEEYRVAGASWRQRNGSHYLGYSDGADGRDETGEIGVSSRGDDEAPLSGSRTTLRLEPHQLTLIRFGEVTWNHTFRAKVRAASTIRMGQAQLPVEIDTRVLDVHVDGNGGRIGCEYVLELTGVPQRVILQIAFESVAQP